MSFKLPPNFGICAAEASTKLLNTLELVFAAAYLVSTVVLIKYKPFQLYFTFWFSFQPCLLEVITKQLDFDLTYKTIQYLTSFKNEIVFPMWIHFLWLLYQSNPNFSSYISGYQKSESYRLKLKVLIGLISAGSSGGELIFCLFQLLWLHHCFPPSIALFLPWPEDLCDYIHARIISQSSTF